MQPPDKFLSQLPALQTADAYFCFIRSWWDDANMDAAFWWQSDAGCFFRVIKTGESITPKLPISDTTSSISQAEFEKILHSVLEMDFLEIPHQPERIIFTHYDNWYGLKSDPSDDGHWLFVQGGRHKDPRAEPLFSLICNQAPLLFTWDDDDEDDDDF